MIRRERTVFSVVAHRDEWQIQRDGRATVHHFDKDQAVRQTHQQAMAVRPSRVIIYNRIGAIEEQASYDELESDAR